MSRRHRTFATLGGLVAAFALGLTGTARAQESPADGAGGGEAVRSIRVSDLERDLPRQIIWERDSAPMMLVPAGEFTRGTNDPAASGGDADESPARQIYLPTFYIDKFEVTNAQYALFLRAMNYPAPAFIQTPGLNASNQPVVGVSWEDARAYATWAGKRLPTEAEWEKAARGVDGRNFPWGNELKAREANTRLAKNRGPSPVGAFPRDESPYGVVDLAGNVAEWTLDWFDQNYYATAPAASPTGPETGKLRVVRGGAWDFDPDRARTISRAGDFPAERRTFYGFRCVVVPGGRAAAGDADALASASGPDALRLPAGDSPSTRTISQEEQWQLFEENLRRFFESHRPITEGMGGDIAALYPAADRRDFHVVNLTDTNLYLAVVNRNRKVLVYDETVRVNASYTTRLPIGETYRFYIIEQGPGPRMQMVKEMQLPAGQKPVSLLFELEGKYRPNTERTRLVEERIVRPRQEVAIVNQTQQAMEVTVTDMATFRVVKEFAINSSDFVIDQLTSGTYRIVAKYTNSPDTFSLTDKFAFESDTIRQTIVIEPVPGSAGEFPQVNLLRSVFVP